ncbi:MAG: hypothetical protein AAB354_11320 [candidate division KSB1 bacterium]
MKVPDWDNSMNENHKLVSGGAASVVTGTALKIGLGGKAVTAALALTKASAIGKVAIAAGAVAGPAAMVVVGGVALGCGLYQNFKKK